MKAQRSQLRSTNAKAKARADACKVLQVAPTADAEIITQAYWYLARKYRAKAGIDDASRRRLDNLNEAYRVLQPGAADAPMLEPLQPVEPQGPSLIEEVGGWLQRVIGETKKRWHGRVPEIGVLTATTALLAFLAFSAGASGILTLVTATIAIVTIWAPWHRV